ncbi:predicted protein [Aspergillus udagawae]|uniref:BZIP domain-containing protein n=1 Tax=Aspergillus udagawae TaxID=91492 RepID=A0ABQ1B9E2_9EURO|nr:predicted protein [Aspergillus udagawae]
MQATLRKDRDKSVQNAASIDSTQVQYHSSATEQNQQKIRAKAAQRAYRERKEQRLIHLKQQIGAMEESNAGLRASNEQLKLEIVRIAAENEVRLATSMNSFTSSHSRPSGNIYDHPVHRLTESKEGDKLLDKVAAWDMIQNHALYKAGLVDIVGVKQKLEGFAQCNGQGIAFEQGRIRSAIENSVISDS